MKPDGKHGAADPVREVTWPPSPDRRRVLAWIGLAGLAPVSMARAATAGRQGSGKPASRKPKVERSPAASAPPSSPPQPEAPSDEARELAVLARRRYGEHLDGKQIEELTRALDRGIKGAQQLRKAKLANADEPDFVFRAES